MTAMSPARAFLYLVVERCRYPLKSLYTVHRIPPWSLFFSSKGGRRLQSEATEIKEAVVPSPVVTLYPSAGDLPMNFVLFGRGKDKIMATDYLGRAFLYDDALRAVSALPSMKDPCYDPVSIAVADDVYFLSNPPDDAHRGCVQALADQTYWSRRSEMHWRYVPPPPYVKKQPKDKTANAVYDGAVEAYALVGESQLWVSAGTYGTYSLDTQQKKIAYSIQGHEITRGEWSKVGDWALPFRGRASYAREHDLWFGLSGRDQSVLCAADLQQQPPVASHEWEGFTAPKTNYQTPVRSFLVHLGTGGRFCIAKFSHDESGRDTAMLTGVEVARCVDGQALCLIKHNTYHYEGFGDDDNPICLL